jgi:nucleotide-binding universal stress UspA family protein
MTRLKKILVATELTPQSALASRRAAQIAHQNDGSLDLLHVIESSRLRQLREFFERDGERLATTHEALCRRDLENEALQAGEALGLSAGRHLRSGQLVEEICATADGLQSDLLVLGAGDTNSLSGLLLGGTAEQLLRRTRLPLLVVRRAVHHHYRRAVLAIDFSRGSHTVVATARQLLHDNGLHLAHVFEIPFESKLRFADADAAVLDQYRSQARQAAGRQLDAFAARAGLVPGSDHGRQILHGHPARRLLEAVHACSAELIVMCKHGLTISDELLVGSVTRQILSEADCDVLVVR